MAGRYKLVNPLQIQREKKVAEPVKGREAEEHVEAEHVGDSNERPVLVPLKDKEVMQAIGLVRQYLRDTGVNINMNKFTTGLLEAKVVPYNPYPGYLRRFRRLSEKFHIQRENLKTVQRRIAQCPTYLTGTGTIAGVKQPEIRIWGLQHILASINPKKIESYRDAVESCCVSQAKISEKCESGITVMTAMTGPCIFTASIYDCCFKITLSVSMLVKCNDFQKAAKLFGTAILCDLEHIHTHKDHHILSLQVPVVTNGESVMRSWSAEEIDLLINSTEFTLKDNLIQEIGFAALGKQDTIVKFLMCLQTKNTSSVLKYVTAEKSYNLLTLSSQRQPNSPQGSPTLFISTTPYQVLHEGIFLQQMEAELYLSTFKNYSGIKSPISTQVSGAVQKKWQEKICQRQLESNVIEVTHFMYLMERAQNPTKPSTSKGEESIAIEILRLVQSTGVKLDRYSTFAKAMRTMASSKSLSINNVDLFKEVLSIYRHHLLEFFDTSSHEFFSAVSTARPVVENSLRKIDHLISEKKFQAIESEMKFTTGYLKGLSIALIEDALDHCPAIRGTKSEIDKIVGTTVGVEVNIDTRPNAYKHKLEIGGNVYSNVDQKVLNLTKCAETIKAPQNISEQVSMMQYCVDARIDEVWKEFLSTLFFRRENLPPNPYPCLITIFRQASLKMQLFRDTEATIAKRLLLNKPKLYDAKFNLYSIPGCSAFGSFSAISLLGVVGYKQVSTMVASAAISPPASGGGAPAIAAGSFELRCYPALSHNVLMYGSASPYLSSLTLEEYCFIRGPIDQEHDGILALAKILLIHLGNLLVQGILPINASFAETNIGLSDITSISARFRNEFVSTVTSRQSVTLTVLIPLDWRYVLLKKMIHVSYVEEMHDQMKFITQLDDMNLYRQVFFNANDAVECCRRIPVIDKSFDSAIQQEISMHWKSCSWEPLAQSLIISSLKNETENHDQKCLEIVAFCWRLYHSSFGAISYTISMGKALMAGLEYFSSDSSTNVAGKNLLKTMVFGYRNILNSVLSLPSTLTTSVMDTYCQDLLQKITACDLTTGSVTLNERELINVLTHVNSVVQSIADPLVMDLIQSSRSIYTTVIGLDK